MRKKTNNSRQRRLLRAARTRRQQARLCVSRLVVHMTGRHTYAQIISPQAKVMASASTAEKAMSDSYGKNGANIPAAQAIGQRLAEKAKSVEIGRLGFDRGGLKYGGRVKALAEAARLAGLSF